MYKGDATHMTLYKALRQIKSLITTFSQSYLTVPEIGLKNVDV